MKHLFSILILLLSINTIQSQLLYDIVDGKYKAKGISEFQSSNDGNFYTELIDGKAIVKYNFRTGELVDTVFSISDVNNKVIKKIDGYSYSPNENRLLIYTNKKMRYRRSFTADYYVFDIKRRELEALSENTPQQVPLFSPDGRYIAFAHNNNLYMKKLDFKTELQITKDGEAGKILNGTPDWAYEEEFSETRFFEWSADSKLLAFVKFDESQVQQFSFQKFNQSETNDEVLPLYPTTYKFKYPKAGMANALVGVYVYDDFNKTTKRMQLNDDNNDIYIPRIQWTNTPDQLTIFKLNRNQTSMDMLVANPRSTVSRLILRFDDKYYVDYSIADKVQFSNDNNSFYILSELDGYRHLYQYRMNGTMVRQITKGNWDVTEFYGYDENNRVAYFQAAQVNPMQREVYRYDSRKHCSVCIASSNGTQSANFNKTFTYFINNHSNVGKPNEYSVRTSTGAMVRNIETNAAVAKKFAALNLAQKEFFTFKTSENITLNGWMLKPQNFNSNKKYPVLMIQYSGPDSQQALDKWNIGWEYYLATQDMIVVSVDGRGTGARGSEFRKSTYQQLGVLEARDQIETAKYLGRQPYIDSNRIAIWGWSYGGSTVLWAMSSGEKVFKAGIAVAPVTDWRLYNTAYTERFMRRPQENFKGYNRTSAIDMADKLNGRLLIIHGTADDNVHVQNTYLYTARLVELNKPFDMHIYTDKDHSISGLQTRRHLYSKMTEFLIQQFSKN